VNVIRITFVRTVVHHNLNGDTMQPKISLYNFDLVRERCPQCGGEEFQFFPKGEDAAARSCSCGNSRELVDFSETSIRRLVVDGSGKFTVLRPRNS
jgi:hypothetical protein